MGFGEIIASVIGLASGTMALYDAVNQKENKNKRIIAVIVIIMLAFAYNFVKYITYRNNIDKTKDRIIEIASGNNPKSLEQLRDKLDKVEYNILVTAVDELVDEHRINEGKVDVKSQQGNIYIVRVYNNVNFPIQ